MERDFTMQKKVVFVILLLNLLAGIASAQIKVGQQAQDFSLFGVDYKYHRLSEYLKKENTKAVVVIFTANHCPVSTEYADTLIKLANKYHPEGIYFIAVNPNPADMVAEDGFPQMIERAKEKGFPFPYVYDETQATARAYDAASTPEVFVADKTGKVVYTGAIDDFGNSPFYLADAIEDILVGRAIEKSHTTAIGCLIEYRR